MSKDRATMQREPAGAPERDKAERAAAAEERFESIKFGQKASTSGIKSKKKVCQGDRAPDKS